MLNYLLLGASCLIVFLSPVWGIGILLVLETSIFCLGSHYATVPLPIGYGGPMDVLIVVILLGAIYRAGLRGVSACFDRQDGEDARIAFKRYRYSRNALLSAILPHLLWLGICGFLVLTFGRLEGDLKPAVRGAISNIIPWSLVAVVWLMRHRSRDILKIILAVAVCTAAVHLAIQFFDLRSLMMTAYWIPADPDLLISLYRQRKILEADVVRCLPPGSCLMLYSLVFCFATFLFDRSHKGWWLLVLYLLLTLALAITITRSLIVLSVAGCIFAIGFGIIFDLVSPRAVRRIVAWAFVAGILATVFLATQPRYRQNWIERLGYFSEDRRIFSEETVRGANNLASITAIQEQPFLGYGMNRYPERFSMIDRDVSDIHPLLKIGLFGGVVAIVLVIRLYLVLLWKFWLACRRERRLAAKMLPYLAILVTIMLHNLVGAGGSLTGRSLIPMALFVGLMAAEMARPDVVSDKLKKRWRKWLIIPAR